MTTNPFASLLERKGTVLLDGAMGTMLMAAGLTSGAAPELWNVEHPDRIMAVHRHYIEAGADLVLTNSFGGTRYRLQLHNLQERVFELNQAAARCARAAADAAGRPVLVAGSIGPTGELLAPMGTMTYAGAVEAFAEQARGLVAGGVDLLWIETMSDLQEVQAAVEGVRSVTDLPLCATMSFDTHGHTMMGVSPQQAVATMRGWDLTAIGANCGNGLAEIEAVAAAMRQAAPDLLLIAKSNAGIPRWLGAELVYDGTPEAMGRYAGRMRQLGVQLIGGCCGSTPAHVKRMAEALARPPAASGQEAAGPSFEVAPAAAAGRERRRQRHRRAGS